MMKSSKAQGSSDNLKVTVFWGDILYDTAICGPNESVTVGRSIGNTFILDLDRASIDANNSFRLMDIRKNRTAELHYDDSIDGHIRIGKELLSLANAKDSKHVRKDANGQYHVQLSTTDKADVVIGHLSFYFDWLDEVETIPPAPIFDRKTALLALALVLLCGGIAFLATMIQPVEEEKPPERLVFLEPKKPKAPPADVATPDTVAPSKAAMGAPQTKDGGAQKGEIGKAATKVPEKVSAAASLRKANLGSLVAGLTSTGSSAPSVNADEAAASAPIEQAGTKGFSTEGLKTGGGGNSVGIGRTVGQGKGGFSGTGRLGLYGNSSVEGTGDGAGGGGTRVGGGLDRSVIESVIHRRLDRVRLCYERQLNFYPKLAGKITVHFAIGKTGTVLSSGVVEDSMKNAAVTSCLTAEVKSWSFPPPEGGTIVNVDYPFVFESTNKGN